MSPLRPVFPPAGGSVALIALAALLAGCSSSNTSENAAVWPWSAPQRVAAAVPVPEKKPDLEDDGREAQVPPPRSIRNVPDDPSEPWSRNYGPQPLPRRADLPADLPPDFRNRLVAAIPE